MTFTYINESNYMSYEGIKDRKLFFLLCSNYLSESLNKTQMLRQWADGSTLTGKVAKFLRTFPAYSYEGLIVPVPLIRPHVHTRVD